MGQEKSEKLLIQGFRFLETKTYQCSEQSYSIDIYEHRQTGMTFSLIPKGDFSMGNEGIDKREIPVHKVSVSSFLLSQKEVSQQVWQQVMSSNPSFNQGENFPVENVNWFECQEFCKRTGLKLPSEAQWEYAYRAGTKTLYYWGEEDGNTYAWQGELTSLTQKVGQKKPNAFGLYDMSGNAWEWCQDTWHWNYYGAPRTAKAWEDSYHLFRVYRGGGLGVSTVYGSASSRSWFMAERKWKQLGFRVAASLK